MGRLSDAWWDWEVGLFLGSESTDWEGMVADLILPGAGVGISQRGWGYSRSCDYVVEAIPRDTS